MAQTNFMALTILLFFTIDAALALSPAPVPAATGFDWRNCTGTGFSVECGESLKSYINYDLGLPPTDACCLELVKIGKPCHDAFLQLHIKGNDYVGTVAKLIQRSELTWTECTDVSDFADPPVSELDVIA